MRIQTKIIFWLLPVILALLVYNLLQYRSQTQELEVGIKHISALVTSNAADELNGFFWNTLHSFETLSEKINQCGMVGSDLDSSTITNIGIALRASPFFGMLAVVNNEGIIQYSQPAPIESNRHIVSGNIAGQRLLNEAQLLKMIALYGEWLDKREDLKFNLHLAEKELSELVIAGQLTSQRYRLIQNKVAQLSLSLHQPPNDVFFGYGEVAQKAGLPFNANTFLYVSPLLNCDNTLSGYLVALLDWTQVEDILLKYSQRFLSGDIEQGEIALLDVKEKRFIRSVTGVSQQHLESTLFPELNTKIEHGNSLSVLSDGSYLSSFRIADEKILSEVKRLLLTSKPISHSQYHQMIQKQSGFYLTAYIPVNEINRILHTSLNKIAYWTLVSLIILIALIIILSRQISEPIKQLSNKMSKVAGGHFTKHVDFERKDEVGELVKSFNRMTEMLENQQTNLENNLSILTSTLESTGDGILVVDTDGKTVQYNQKFAEIWKVPTKILDTHDDKKILQFAQKQLEDPDEFISKVQLLYENKTQVSNDILFFKDGRVIERYSQPQSQGDEIIGRVWSYRDVTEQYQTREALIKEKDFAKNLIDTAQMIIMVLDTKGHIVLINAFMEQLTGYKQEAVVGKNWFEQFLPPNSQTDIRQLFREAISGSHTDGNVNTIVTSSGQLCDIKWYNKTLRDKHNDIVGILSVGLNITEQKAAEQATREATAIKDSIITTLPDLVWLKDPEGVYLACNPVFERFLGAKEAEIVGKTDYDFVDTKLADFFQKNDLEAINAGVPRSNEEWLTFADDGHRALLLTIKTPMYDDKGNLVGVLGISRDITVQKEHQQQLEYIAHYDALTSLPNRLLLTDRLHQSMVQSVRRELKVAVAYIDLDGFKEVNDNHGHDIGDQLLVTLSARMKQALREGDSIARLGGDEFVAVFTDLNDPQSSVPMLTRMLKAIAKPVTFDGLSLQVSASIGITFYPQDEDVEADQLLRQADQAMYQAKIKGKNRYHIFDAEEDRSVRGRHESLERIQEALIKEEFVLFYQPKVNMRTGEVVGVEALIRWQHPEEGLLSPVYFLPVIEDDPLSIDVGDWVLCNALRQMKKWKAEGINIPVSINVGAYQLQQSDFVERMQLRLGAHPEFVPGSLILEVLETSALEDVVHTSNVMHECRKLGVRFSLDDFGTGYSSLTYLKRLPASELKIDQSFIRDMIDDPEDLAIVQGVLSLSNAFLRHTIAEGVEAAEHGRILIQLGCELAQGYGIAKPMPADDIARWKKEWQRPLEWHGVNPISNKQLHLLFAATEHRAWVKKVEEYINDRRSLLPSIHHKDCRFGKWLASPAALVYTEDKLMKNVKDLHALTHKLVQQMVELHKNDHKEEAINKMTELHSIRDELLLNLQQLIDKES